MTLEEIIGSRLVFGIPGTAVTPEIVDHFRQTHAGGLILYRINFESPDQVRKLISDLENAIERRLLVTADMEGGRVIMFSDGVTIFPSAQAFGRTGNTQLALKGMQLCQSVPGTQQSADGWRIGFSWTMSFPWHIPVNRYTHNNTPNKLTCFNPNDQCCGMGGTDPMATATSNHPGGVNVCFTDGSVRFVKDSVGAQVWWALGSRNLGEVVSSDSY